MPEVTPDDIDEEIDIDESEKPKRESSLNKQLREESEQSILDYLQELAAESPIKVTVIREWPKTWEGKSGVAGTLDTHDEPLSEEDIKELYGGGKYKLMIRAPNAKGSFVYKTSKRLTIAGEPKLDGLITSTASSVKEDSPSLARDALRMAQVQAERAEQRAERAEQRRARPQEDGALQLLMEELRTSRMDSAEKDRRILEFVAGRQDDSRESGTLQLVMEELRSARAESSEKDRRFMEMMTSRSQGSSAAEMLLGKAIEGESVRIQAMQTQHDSELRMRGDMHRAEIDRLHARYEEIARRQEETHKREIDNLRQSVENQISTLKMSYEGQIAGYQREITRQDRELSAAKAEAAELRSRKERGLLESVTEMASLKEALESFAGGGDKKEEGSAIERIIQSVVGSSLAEGIAARLAGGPESMGMVQNPSPEPEMPVNQPVRTPDGRVLVRQEDGRILELRQKARQPQPTGEAVKGPSEDDLAIILPFMEGSLASDTNPEEFVRTARSLAPGAVSGPVKQLIQAQGADAFLELVAQVRPESPLLQQHGKNWTRKVAAILLE